MLQLMTHLNKDEMHNNEDEIIEKSLLSQIKNDSYRIIFTWIPTLSLYNIAEYITNSTNKVASIGSGNLGIVLHFLVSGLIDNVIFYYLSESIDSLYCWIFRGIVYISYSLLMFCVIIPRVFLSSFEPIRWGSVRDGFSTSALLNLFIILPLHKLYSCYLK